MKPTVKSLPMGLRESHKPHTVDRPSLQQLAPAFEGCAGRSILFVNGYLTSDGDYSQWLLGFRRQGWRGAVYVLNWDAGGQCAPHFGGAVVGTAVGIEVLAWGLTLLPGVGPVMAASRAAGWGFRAAKAATYVGTLRSGLLEHWKQQDQMARIEGQRLGEFLSHGRPTWAKDELRLAGMSLGARVIYEALCTATASGQSVVDDVDLFGSAVHVSHGWSSALQSVSGAVRNFYSRKDRVLKHGFVAAEGELPIGLSPITDGGRPHGRARPAWPNRFENIDVTDLVRNHSDYPKRISHERFSIARRASLR
jgi:hypothetical protein